MSVVGYSVQGPAGASKFGEAAKHGAVGKAMDIRWVENVRKGFKKAMRRRSGAREEGGHDGEEKDDGTSFDVDPAGWGVSKWREAWEKKKVEAASKENAPLLSASGFAREGEYRAGDTAAAAAEELAYHAAFRSRRARAHAGGVADEGGVGGCELDGARPDFENTFPRENRSRKSHAPRGGVPRENRSRKSHGRSRGGRFYERTPAPSRAARARKSTHTGVV